MLQLLQNYASSAFPKIVHKASARWFWLRKGPSPFESKCLWGVRPLKWFPGAEIVLRLPPPPPHSSDRTGLFSLQVAISPSWQCFVEQWSSRKDTPDNNSTWDDSTIQFKDFIPVHSTLVSGLIWSMESWQCHMKDSFKWNSTNIKSIDLNFDWPIRFAMKLRIKG